MAQQESVLSYSIRPAIVAKYLGLLFLVSTVTLAVPLIASLIWGEYPIALRYGICIAVLLLLGLPSLKIQRPKTLQSNQAYSIIGLAFFFGSLAAVYPMMGSGLSFVDAWFESLSGITTTGLSTVDLSSIESRTFFFARAWEQWYGGLGIIVFSLGLAFQPGTASKELFKKVVNQDDLVENSKVFARKILIIYCLITLVGLIVFKSLGLSFATTFELAFAAISTGGFSPFADSLASLSFHVQAAVILLGFFGALSFPLFWLTSSKAWKELAKDTQLLALISCCILFTALLIAFTPRTWTSFAPNALLNVISLQTTTGFATMDFSSLDNPSKLSLIASMFIGGSSQSTAGGLKLLRVIMIFKALRFLFFRTSLSPHAVSFYDFGAQSKQISKETIACFSFFALYILTTFFSTLVFVIMGYDPIDSLFEVVSAIGTVGVSVGVTSAHLPDLLKYLLGFDMLLGRLEIVTLLVLLYPKTLIGRRMNS